MGNKIAGITLEISGNTEPLNKALAGSNKQSRDLQNELKEVDKLLKLDPKNTELVTQKQKLLAESINTSANKLGVLKQAEKQAREQFENGKIGEEQMRALQREIVETEEKLKKAKKESKDFGDKTKNAGVEAATAFDAAGDKLDAIAGKMNTVSMAAGAVTTGMVALAAKTALLADDLNTLSTQTGLSTDELQKFQYASDLIDVDMETLTGSMSKLIKNMATAQKGTGDAAAAFTELGISITDGNGELRDHHEVFDEVIKKLGEYENGTERDALAMQILGKSAQDLNPLIMGGADALKELGNEAEEAGLILSGDTLDTINEFNDEIDTMKATVKGTANVVGAALAEEMLPILQETTPILKDILKWIRELDSGTLAVIAVIAAVVTAIGPLLTALGQMSHGISAIMRITPMLSGAFSGFGTSIMGVVTSITSFLGPAGTVILIIMAIIAALVLLYNTNEDFKKFVDGLAEYIIEGLQGVVDWLAENWEKGWDAHMQAAQKVADMFKEYIGKLPPDIQDILNGIINFLAGTFTGNWTKAWEGLKQAVGGAFGTLESMVKAPINAVIRLVNGAIKSINAMIQGVNSLGSSVGAGFSVPHISEIPMLAKGGILHEGLAIVGEAGPELLQVRNGKGIVTPLTGTASAAALASGGDVFNINIPVNNIKELNDIIRICNNARQARRAK